jgi:adenine C2-methylase RlmN of 23S rRNA A2503 and tRNA A37
MDLVTAPKILHSVLDASVNFVFPNGLEARFVHRPGTDYFIVYLSSHRGCDQACRFCHLTQTKQTDMTPATVDEYEIQMKYVTDHYMSLLGNDKIPVLKKVHFNWMARGEPLLNPHLISSWKYIDALCGFHAHNVGVYESKFKISTIMPDVQNPLNGFKVFSTQPSLPTIYYSLYSTDENFRKRWLPKAMAPKEAMKHLKSYQDFCLDNYGIDDAVVLHWAFIEGQNDSKEDVDKIIDLVNKSGLSTRFNLVRYNPYSPAQGREPAEEVVQERFEQLSSAMKLSGSKVVPRVGRDVYASCGTFINQLSN